MSRYRKFLASLAPVVVLVGESITDGSVSSGEAQGIALAAISAFLVWRLPNKQPMGVIGNMR